MRGAALFKLIWDSVADVLGTTAAATLLRRAAQRAVPRSPELDDFAVTRTDAGYSYSLPRASSGSWSTRRLRCVSWSASFDRCWWN